MSFTQFTLSSPNVRGSVRAGTDPLPADNSFHFVLAPSEPVSLVVVDSGDRSASSLFLSKALSIGTTPVFRVDVTSASRLTPASLDKRAVVILNDTMFPPAGGGGVLKKFLERGGGLLVVSGDRATATDRTARFAVFEDATETGLTVIASPNPTASEPLQPLR